MKYANLDTKRRRKILSGSISIENKQKYRRGLRRVSDTLGLDVRLRTIPATLVGVGEDISHTTKPLLCKDGEQNDEQSNDKE